MKNKKKTSKPRRALTVNAYLEVQRIIKLSELKQLELQKRADKELSEIKTSLEKWCESESKRNHARAEDIKKRNDAHHDMLMLALNTFSDLVKTLIEGQKK